MKDNIVIYAVMPKDVYLTKKLTCGEKLIAERITSLCKKEGYCWISNKALADMYGLREDTVSKYIKRLKNYGFIKCVYKKEKDIKSSRVIYLINHIWDKYPNGNSINNQDDIGYITEYNNNYNNKKNKKYNMPVPDWLGKDIDKEPISDEDKKELEELLKEYKS